MTKLLHIFPVGKFSLEFEEDTFLQLFHTDMEVQLDSKINKQNTPQSSDT